MYGTTAAKIMVIFMVTQHTETVTIWDLQRKKRKKYSNKGVTILLAM
jgi:hypothetical protein